MSKTVEHRNQSQPNPGPRPDGPPCTSLRTRETNTTARRGSYIIVCALVSMPTMSVRKLIENDRVSGETAWEANDPKLILSLEIPYFILNR